MKRTIKKNKDGEIEIEEDGDVEEYIAFDEMCDEDGSWDSKYCDEDGIPYDMMDEEGNMLE